MVKFGTKTASTLPGFIACLLLFACAPHHHISSNISNTRYDDVIANPHYYDGKYVKIDGLIDCANTDILPIQYLLTGINFENAIIFDVDSDNREKILRKYRGFNVEVIGIFAKRAPIVLNKSRGLNKFDLYYIHESDIIGILTNFKIRKLSKKTYNC